MKNQTRYPQRGSTPHSIAHATAPICLAASIMLSTAAAGEVHPGLPGGEGLALNGHSSADFCSDGSRIVTLSGSPSGFTVWDCRSGEALLRNDVPMPRPGAAGKAPTPFSRVLFALDGQKLITAGSRPTDGLAIWDARSGELQKAFGADLQAWCPVQKGPWPAPESNSSFRFMRLALSPDGTRVYVWAHDYSRMGYPGALGCWDSATGELRFSIPESSGTVQTMRLGPDAKHVVGYVLQGGMGSRAGGGPRGPGIGVWDAASGQRTHLLPFAHGLGSVTFQGPPMAFSPDGERLTVYAGESQGQGKAGARTSAPAALRTWDLRTGAEAAAIPLAAVKAPSCRQILFSPDGRLVALVLGGGRVALLDPASGKPQRSLESKTAVNDIAFSADGRLLAAGCGDPNEMFGSTGDVKLWRVRDGELVRHFRGQRGLVSVRFSPDGWRLLSLSHSSAVLWNVPTE